jgi:hypothetical protein
MCVSAVPAHFSLVRTSKLQRVAQYARSGGVVVERCRQLRCLQAYGLPDSGQPNLTYTMLKRALFWLGHVVAFFPVLRRCVCVSIRTSSAHASMELLL